MVCATVAVPAVGLLTTLIGEKAGVELRGLIWARRKLGTRIIPLSCGGRGNQLTALEESIRMRP